MDPRTEAALRAMATRWTKDDPRPRQPVAAPMPDTAELDAMAKRVLARWSTDRLLRGLAEFESNQRRRVR